MAHSNCCLSDARVVDPPCNFDGTGSGILRRRDDAGNVGLPAATDPDKRGISAHYRRSAEENQNRYTLASFSQHKPVLDDVERQHTREVRLLSDLLAPSTGKDALQLSRALLDSHGSLSTLLLEVRHGLPPKVELSEGAAARIDDLMSVLLHAWEVEAYIGPVLSSSTALRRYLQVDMAGCRRENFRVLFLDASNHLLLDRIMWEGTVSSVQAHPREIVRLALLTNATAVILAHNHPSGCMRPSREDIKITRNIVDACASLDICVHDHLIVTRGGVISIMHG